MEVLEQNKIEKLYGCDPLTCEPFGCPKLTGESFGCPKLTCEPFGCPKLTCQSYGCPKLIPCQSLGHTCLAHHQCMVVCRALGTEIVRDEESEEKGHQCMVVCRALGTVCPTFNICGTILQCGGQLYIKLTDSLKACGEGFYLKCPGFDEVGRVCEFDPAIDASKLKERMHIERINQLEAKVRELEVLKRNA